MYFNYIPFVIAVSEFNSPYGVHYRLLIKFPRDKLCVLDRELILHVTHSVHLLEFDSLSVIWWPSAICLMIWTVHSLSESSRTLTIL
jgi:hypothetical protein